MKNERGRKIREKRKCLGNVKCKEGNSKNERNVRDEIEREGEKEKVRKKSTGMKEREKDKFRKKKRKGEKKRERKRERVKWMYRKGERE